MLPQLDESQRRVIEAETSERRFVVAGPGTGKTTTSVALIQEIASREEGSDVAVLYVSFSRAAMRAAFAAFGDAIGELPIEVMAMTLDSLAWQLLDEPLPDHHEPDFDDVVRKATEKIQKDYEGEFDDVVHLIVDEAQDLSLPRRLLLEAVIDKLPSRAGVTIFGDPLQSIFDFHDGGTVPTNAWGDLVASMREKGFTTTYTLDVDHRARRRGPKKVAAVSSTLRTLDAQEARTDELADLLTEFSRMTAEEFAVLARQWKGHTGVLVRTNAEVAYVFDTLVGHGLVCRWREPGRASPAVAPWVASLWRSTGGANVSRDDFARFAADRDDVDVGWFRLLLDEAEQRGRVDWRGLVRAFRGAVDPLRPWFDTSPAAVTVSTIHQAKGLEWDNVAVVAADDLLSAVGSRCPEPEVLFVALSRARERVVLLDWKQPYTRSERALIYQPHPMTGRPLAIRFTPDALRSDRQIGGAPGQRALETANRNSSVEFELLASGQAPWPTYRCLLDGEPVGVTSSGFGQSFARVLRSSGSPWPSLGPVPMDGVETRWSTSSGVELWLQPRLFGIAEITYEKG
ncbi:UvrD-helicase domain-containing protein [Gordonia paraffinivorans]|uniref:UvrD-helicase domain-containing protein n=1 Tax=Gordonia paraffinivorans TaxID=175628 RepID=UPI001447671F|nr:ATP-dependent helicase [Gordonia paraffinivorans]